LFQFNYYFVSFQSAGGKIGGRKGGSYVGPVNGSTSKFFRESIIVAKVRSNLFSFLVFSLITIWFIFSLLAEKGRQLYRACDGQKKQVLWHAQQRSQSKKHVNFKLKLIFLW
jgi:hypothetical protein